MSGDIEEELELFFIRRPVGANGDNKGDNRESTEKVAAIKIHKRIPLLLGDVKSLKSTHQDNCNNSTSFYAFGSLPFESFLAYVHVVGRLNDTEHFRIYLIDDGTATMELSVYKVQEKIAAVSGLTEDLHDFLDMAKRCELKELAEPLAHLLDKAKENLNSHNLKMGDKILVCARPTIFRGKLGVRALDIACDSQSNRYMEIAFKKCLIDFYMRNYPAVQS